MVLKACKRYPGTAGQVDIIQDPTIFLMITTQAAQDAVPGTGGLGLSSDTLTSVSGALSAMAAVNADLKSVSDARAVYGASTNRLTAALSNLQVTFTNYQAAESRIRDADFAFETAVYSRNQIMVQAGVSVLAQANSLPQNVLSLLR